MVLHNSEAVSLTPFLSLFHLPSCFNMSSSQSVPLILIGVYPVREVSDGFFFIFNYKFCNASWILLTVLKFLK